MNLSCSIVSGYQNFILDEFVQDNLRPKLDLLSLKILKRQLAQIHLFYHGDRLWITIAALTTLSQWF